MIPNASRIGPLPAGHEEIHLRANIANFEKLRRETSDPALRRTLEGLLASNRRELALLEAEKQGAQVTSVGSRGLS